VELFQPLQKIAGPIAGALRGGLYRLHPAGSGGGQSGTRSREIEEIIVENSDRRDKSAETIDKSRTATIEERNLMATDLQMGQSPKLMHALTAQRVQFILKISRYQRGLQSHGPSLAVPTSIRKSINMSVLSPKVAKGSRKLEMQEKRVYLRYLPAHPTVREG